MSERTAACTSVEAVFRREHGRIIAGLIRLCGSFDRAEEAIMLYFLQVSAGTADHVQELGQAAWAVQDADRDPD